jgi:hypothetical protein
MDLEESEESYMSEGTKDEKTYLDSQLFEHLQEAKAEKVKTMKAIEFNSRLEKIEEKSNSSGRGSNRKLALTMSNQNRDIAILDEA